MQRGLSHRRGNESNCIRGEREIGELLPLDRDQIKISDLPSHAEKCYKDRYDYKVSRVTRDDQSQLVEGFVQRMIYDRDSASHLEGNKIK